MTTHSLKVWPEFFDALQSTDKLFELRRDDRDFKVDDWLKLREWKPADIMAGEPAAFTGQRMLRQVAYVLRGEDTCALTGPEDGLDSPVAKGWVILGLRQPLIELECRLFGRRLFLESTRAQDGEEATKYLAQLTALVQGMKEADSEKRIADLGGGE